MFVDQNGVHLGTALGVQTLTHDLRTILRTTAFPGNGASGVWGMTGSRGKLYIVIEGATSDNVREIDSVTHEESGRWTLRGSPFNPIVSH